MQFSYDLENVVYEEENFWILKEPNHYEIYQILSTHSRRRAIVGFIGNSEQERLQHAIEVLERLVKQDAHSIL